MTSPDVAERATAGGRSRNSCFLVGCLVLLALVTIPGAVVWAFFAATDELGPSRPRHEVREHVLPAGRGTIDLGVRMAEVEVVPAAAGAPLRLEVDWDPAIFRLDEKLEEVDGGWRYRLRFGGRGLALLRSRHHHGDANRLRLAIPVDRPLSIEGRLGLAETDIELGGLSLERVSLKLGAGEHRLSFHTPTAHPLEALELDGSMGEITVLGAGNASPRVLVLRHGMGELTLDLTGQWRADGDVELHLGMGDSSILLPRPEEAGAVVDKARVALGDRQVFDRRLDELPPGVPRVHVRATGGMGGLRIQ